MPENIAVPLDHVQKWYILELFFSFFACLNIIVLDRFQYFFFFVQTEAVQLPLSR